MDTAKTHGVRLAPPAKDHAQAAYIESLRIRQLLCNWAGPVLVAVFFVGLVPFMGFVPPQLPTATGEEIAAIYMADLAAIRTGIVICSSSCVFMAIWGGLIAARTKRTEQEVPVYTYVQLGALGCCVMVGVLCFLVWAVAAFRPDDLHPDVTRMLNDLGWFLFLYDVAPFIVWMLAFGLAILGNRSQYRLAPRWVGYFSIWCAIGEAPAVLILFFKEGAFAFNGLVGFWLPLIAFFAWILVVSVAMHKEINLDAKQGQAALPGNPSSE